MADPTVDQVRSGVQDLVVLPAVAPLTQGGLLDSRRMCSKAPFLWLVGKAGVSTQQDEVKRLDGLDSTL